MTTSDLTRTWKTNETNNSKLDSDLGHNNSKLDSDLEDNDSKCDKTRGDLIGVDLCFSSLGGHARTLIISVDDKQSWQLRLRGLLPVRPKYFNLATKTTTPMESRGLQNVNSVHIR